MEHGSSRIHNRQNVWLVLDVDHTLKSLNRLWHTPPVFGMPELIQSCNRIHQCTITYLTNRWLGLDAPNIGATSFLQQYYPPGEIYQRPVRDFFGWARKAPQHKLDTLAQLITAKGWMQSVDGGKGDDVKSSKAEIFDYVLFLGDNVDMDPEVYAQCVKESEGSIPSTLTKIIIGIRIVELHHVKKPTAADPIGVLDTRVQGIFDELTKQGPSRHKVYCFMYSNVSDLTRELHTAGLYTGISSSSSSSTSISGNTKTVQQPVEK